MSDADLATEALPLNFNSDKAEQEFKEVMGSMPKNVSMYIVGGAVRNAITRYFHGDKLPQRDYDQVITQDSDEYIKFLESRGYQCRPYPGRTTQVVYRKQLTDNSEEDYFNWLVFDMHTVDGTTIMENLKFKTGFTINAIAVPGKEVLNKNWQEIIISLPSSVDDIKNRQIRLNLDGYKHEPSNFFGMIRFISAGFKPPKEDEVKLLLDELPKLQHERFDRNVKKVFEYVGGEEKAREIVKSLGISIDVFDEDKVKL